MGISTIRCCWLYCALLVETTYFNPLHVLAIMNLSYFTDYLDCHVITYVLLLMNKRFVWSIVIQYEYMAKLYSVPEPNIAIIRKIAELFQTRYLAGWEWVYDPITPAVRQQIIHNLFESEGWTADVTLHSPVAVVSRHGLVYQVNRELLTCSCRLWQLSGIPYPHACRCIDVWGDNVDAYVHKLLSVDEYRSAYGPGMNMLPEITQWECQSYDHVLPPMTRYSTCTCFEESNHHPEITPYNYSFPMRFTNTKDCLIFYITQ